jgi:hypothetical protein
MKKSLHCDCSRFELIISTKLFLISTFFQLVFLFSLSAVRPFPEQNGGLKIKKSKFSKFKNSRAK